jgi:hypothetical protein
LHFVDRDRDVVDGDLIRRDEALGVGRRELDERVVERLRGLAPARLDEVQVAERTELAIADLDIDAVLVHVLQPFDGVAVAGSADRVPHPLEALRHRVHALADRDAAAHLGNCGVVGGMELGGEPSLHRVVGDGHV